jgi:hypothetical protein
MVSVSIELSSSLFLIFGIASGVIISEIAKDIYHHYVKKFARHIIKRGDTVLS